MSRYVFAMLVVLSGCLGMAVSSATVTQEAMTVGPLHGQIVADPDQPGLLKRHGGDDIFICGPGDPEDFLYRGELQPDGTRDGDQDRLIRRLLEFGGNCLYLQMVRSHGGDGQADHNPFRNHEPSQGLNPAVLRQWESWFEILDQHGILIYLMFYDDGSDPWMTADLEAGERQFVKEIVERFAHHRNLIWIVSEESEEALSGTRAQAIARWIRQNDPHQHLIGNHYHSSVVFPHDHATPAFDHYAMQLNVPPQQVYQHTRQALQYAKGRYQLLYVENTEIDASNEAWLRHSWTVAMAGAMPMLLGMDVVRSSDQSLRQCRILSEFFQQADFAELHPRTLESSRSDGLGRLEMISEQGAHLIWMPGEEKDVATVDVIPGNLHWKWLDCRTGRQVERTVRVDTHTLQLQKPDSIQFPCAVYVRPVQEISLETPFPGAQWTERSPADVSVSLDKLREFQELVGGRGCVIKDGYLIHQWGDIQKPGDLASASKPLYAHLLLRALEEQRLESVDDRVLRFRPCLGNLNPALDFKDQGLTFRHLAFQTACLGYQEQPGNAFDYNDHTMGLFWDLVVNDLWGTPWSEANQLWERELVDPLQMQDGFSFPIDGRMRGRPSLSPRDFARFGWLYLNHGQWKDQQLLSRRLADHAFDEPLPIQLPRTLGEEAERCATRSIGGGGNQADHNGGYSWLWWTNHLSRDGQRWWPDAPADMYCALGHCGQRGIAIFPTQRIVVSWNDGRELHCDRQLGNRAFRAIGQSSQ